MLVWLAPQSSDRRLEKLLANKWHFSSGINYPDGHGRPLQHSEPFISCLKHFLSRLIPITKAFVQDSLHNETQTKLISYLGL